MTSVSAPSSVKSSCIISTPVMGSISRMSTASTEPPSPMRLRAICDQPPGAAPRSTMRWPFANRPKRSSSWMILKAARER